MRTVHRNTLHLMDSGHSGLFAKAQRAVFTTLYVLNKKVAFNDKVSIIMMGIDFLQVSFVDANCGARFTLWQMLAFPLSSMPGLPWQNIPIMMPILQFGGFLSVWDILTTLSPTVQMLLFYSAIGWVTTTIGLAVYVSNGFMNEDFSSVWPIKVSGW